MDEDQETIAKLQRIILKLQKQQMERDDYFLAHISPYQKRAAKFKAENLKIQKELDLLKKQTRK